MQYLKKLNCIYFFSGSRRVHATNEQRNMSSVGYL